MIDQPVTNPNDKEPVDIWPWDWDFRNNCCYEERGRSLRRRGSNDSLLSDCLSEVSRHHASASPGGSGSYHRGSRNASPYQPVSLYCDEVASLSRESGDQNPHATVSMTQLDVGKSQRKRARRRSSSPPEDQGPETGVADGTELVRVQLSDEPGATMPEPRICSEYFTEPDLSSKETVDEKRQKIRNETPALSEWKGANSKRHLRGEDTPVHDILSAGGAVKIALKVLDHGATIHALDEANLPAQIQQPGDVTQKLCYGVPTDTIKKPDSKPTGGKSSGQVSCEVCHNFTGRPSEVKKHMKRHSRQYGCTYLACGKTFGSKNDWKRHENTQHFTPQMWRCDAIIPYRRLITCGKVFYRHKTFKDHLLRIHRMSRNDEEIETKMKKCEIRRNNQGQFWCGFCRKMVELTTKGSAAWIERHSHIGDHIEKEGREMHNWMPVNFCVKDL